MTTASEQLHSVALEWMETRGIIAQALGDFYGGTYLGRETYAAAIIARLSHAGYSIEKVAELRGTATSHGASASVAGCSGGGPSNIGGGGGA